MFVLYLIFPLSFTAEFYPGFLKMYILYQLGPVMVKLVYWIGLGAVQEISKAHFWMFLVSHRGVDLGSLSGLWPLLCIVPVLCLLATMNLASACLL